MSSDDGSTGSTQGLFFPEIRKGAAAQVDLTKEERRRARDVFHESGGMHSLSRIVQVLRDTIGPNVSEDEVRKLLQDAASAPAAPPTSPRRGARDRSMSARYDPFADAGYLHLSQWYQLLRMRKQRAWLMSAGTGEDIRRAFAALGGGDDGSGTVPAESISAVGSVFGICTPRSGQSGLDYNQFSALFDAENGRMSMRKKRRGSSPRSRHGRRRDSGFAWLDSIGTAVPERGRHSTTGTPVEEDRPDADSALLVQLRDLHSSMEHATTSDAGACSNLNSGPSRGCIRGKATPSTGPRRPPQGASPAVVSLGPSFASSDGHGGEEALASPGPEPARARESEHSSSVLLAPAQALEGAASAACCAALCISAAASCHVQKLHAVALPTAAPATAAGVVLRAGVTVRTRRGRRVLREEVTAATKVWGRHRELRGGWLSTVASGQRAGQTDFVSPEEVLPARPRTASAAAVGKHGVDIDAAPASPSGFEMTFCDKCVCHTLGMTFCGDCGTRKVRAVLALRAGHPDDDVSAVRRTRLAPLHRHSNARRKVRQAVRQKFAHLSPSKFLRPLHSLSFNLSNRTV